MSDKRSPKNKNLTPQPALAQMLFATMTEHETVLSRVSRLLHDDVSQVLSAVGFQLDAMREEFHDQAPGVEARTAEIQELLERAIGHLRDISNELNPSIVERAGLQFALDRLIGGIRAEFDGTLRFHYDAALHVPTGLAKSFYKIAECALKLAQSTPGCSFIDVHVKRSHGNYVVEISNNAPADPNDPSPLEQLLMEHHASNAQITFRAERLRDKGSLVRASFPLAETPPADGS